MYEFTLTGVVPYDGAYEIDLNLSKIKGDELHLIKAVSGVRLGELPDALGKADWDVIVAYATIALIRNGKITKEMGRRTADLILAEPVDCITFRDLDEETVDPPLVPPRGGKSESDSDSSSTIS